MLRVMKKLISPIEFVSKVHFKGEESEEEVKYINEILFLRGFVNLKITVILYVQYACIKMPGCMMHEQNDSKIKARLNTCTLLGQTFMEILHDSFMNTSNLAQSGSFYKIRIY